MSAQFSATELVEIARQIERCGETFYRGAALTVRSETVRELFEHLAQEEVSHAFELEAVLSRLGGGSEDWRDDDEHVAYMRTLAIGRVFPSPDAVAATVQGLRSEREAVGLAIRFENDTIAFLEGLARMVRAEDRKALDAMIEEEHGHVRRLSEVAAVLPPAP